MDTFDWTLAISRNRDALLRIVAVMFALAGIGAGRSVATLPRHLRSRILLILRPAESALRRLIIIAARGLVVKVRPARSVILGLDPSAHSVKLAKPAIREKDAVDKPGAFPLLDPLKRFDFNAKRYATTVPRIGALCRDWSVPVYLRRPGPPAKAEPSPDDPIDVARLCRRLHRLRNALDDLDGQARRMARWKARRDLASRLQQAANQKNARSSPMRPGWPPGHRKRHIHDIDEVLAECHSLAVYARSLPDTS